MPQKCQALNQLHPPFFVRRNALTLYPVFDILMRALERIDNVSQGFCNCPSI